MMISEDPLDLENQDSWFYSNLQWCPTSSKILKEAEDKILKNLRTKFRSFYVHLDNVVGDVENKIWTIVLNENSKNTPLVLIHGFGAGNAFWFLNYDNLAKNRPVYAIDILGFGRSSRPTFASDATRAEAEFISSIEEWRKIMNLDKFILIGHSFGGFLATSYSMKYPDRISHLILADPWGFPERPCSALVSKENNLAWMIRQVSFVAHIFNPLFIIRAAGPLGHFIISTATRGTAKPYSENLKDTGNQISSYFYHCNAQNIPSGETAFYYMMQRFGWAKYPMLKRIHSIKEDVHISFIYGEKTWIDRNSGFHAKYIRKHSYVDIQFIEHAGHQVFSDNATDFNKAVLNIAKYVDQGHLPPLTRTLDENYQKWIWSYEESHDG